MQFFEKDVETLRGAYQQLSTQITRSDFIRLVVLFIMITSFARAFELINTAETNQKQRTIRVLEEQQKEKVAQNKITPLAAALQNTNPAQTSGEKIAAQAESAHVEPDEAKNFQEESATTPNELETIEVELKHAQEALETSYRQAFRVKIPFVGGDPTIDLRSWIYGLPFLFILSEVYLFILRKQLKLLSLITTYIADLLSQGMFL